MSSTRRWLSKWVVSYVFHVWSKMGVVYNINEARQLHTISKISTGYRLKTGSNCLWGTYRYSQNGFYVPQLSCSKPMSLWAVTWSCSSKTGIGYMDSRVLEQFKSRNNWISVATIHHKPTFGSWGAYWSFGNFDETVFLTVKKWNFAKFWV